MYNKAILIGRVGAKPTIKEGKTGVKYCHFSLVTEVGFGDKKRVDWHSITAFGKTAENCEKFLDKGSLIVVEGSIAYQQYKVGDKNAKSTSIMAEKVVFLSSSKQKESEQQTNDSLFQPAPQIDNAQYDNPFVDLPSEDIPF